MDVLRYYIQSGRWNGDLDRAGELFDTPSYDAKPDLGEAWVDVKRACASYIRAAVG